MGAGKYRHKVQIQERTRTKGASGVPVDTWVKFRDTWSNPKTVNGRERWANERTANEYDVAFEMRYQTGITEDMRIVYGTRTLQVSTVIDVDERRRELVVLCKEIKNG